YCANLGKPVPFMEIKVLGIIFSGDLRHKLLFKFCGYLRGFVVKNHSEEHPPQLPIPILLASGVIADLAILALLAIEAPKKLVYLFSGCGKPAVIFRLSGAVQALPRNKLNRYY